MTTADRIDNHVALEVKTGSRSRANVSNSSQFDAGSVSPRRRALLW
jgi:hypothetical protein